MYDSSDMLPCGYAGNPEAWSHVFKVESSEDLVVPRMVQEENVHLEPQFVEMRAKAEVRFLLKCECAYSLSDVDGKSWI
jgi:hypothetical protein